MDMLIASIRLNFLSMWISVQPVICRLRAERGDEQVWPLMFGENSEQLWQGVSSNYSCFFKLSVEVS